MLIIQALPHGVVHGIIGRVRADQRRVQREPRRVVCACRRQVHQADVHEGGVRGVDEMRELHCVVFEWDEIQLEGDG